MNWLSELGKFIQQTTKVWLGLFLASGFLWLLPKLVIVGDAADKSNSYFGAAVKVIFILSASMLLSDLVFFGRDYIRDRNAKNSKFEVLKRLTPPERELMRRYLEAETKSLGLDPRDMTVVLFSSRKWISQPFNYVGATSGTGNQFLPPHVLEDWIYYYLKDNPELIA